jgi:hypothetical protein
MTGRIKSGSRRERINKNLGALYDRVSAGVHADVTIDEAQALVLQHLFAARRNCVHSADR